MYPPVDEHRERCSPSVRKVSFFPVFQAEEQDVERQAHLQQQESESLRSIRQGFKRGTAGLGTPASLRRALCCVVDVFQFVVERRM